jgi:ketosteroid isomerase-like protein
MTGADDALDTVRRWLAAFNDQDWGRFQALLTPDAVLTQRATGQVDRTADGVVASYQAWRARYTELRGEIVDGFGCSTRAAAEIQWTGFDKAYQVPIRFPACFLFTLRDGRLAEMVDFYDELTTMRQRGLAP